MPQLVVGFALEAKCCGFESLYAHHFLVYASVTQRLERRSSKAEMRVRFPPGAPMIKECICCNCNTQFQHDTSITRGRFCSLKCSAEFLRKESHKLFHAGLLKWRKTIKIVMIEIFGYKCQECSISEWQNKPICLQVHHKDGNCTNNFPNNLTLLCPNCHSQTPNYGSKNNGNGRGSRGISLG